jgi:phosphinothricin acetyltransferase
VSDISVRAVADGDAEDIRAIYNPEVLESTVTFDLVPRTLDEQLAWQHERSGAHAVLVAVDDATGELLGYASLSSYKARAAYATTVEDSVYIRRDQQGRGVGKLLLAELLAVATAHGFHAVMARIVGGHDASIALHARLGFEIVGTEREVGRKFGRWLDVVVMQKLL